ncbi:MAG TPA: IclR family transcriptional regulator [Chloroflexi bacterium]|nr:IclR family transcriptional regulator [Chloroflexota bacterium]
MKDQSEYNVRAVERALLILDCFDSENPERGVSEIAQAVDLHKATTHRIVTTLLNYGYLERTEDDQRYRLGLKLASLGCQVIDQMDLRQEALPYMNKLVEQWNETCDLSIFDQERVFYVEVLHSNHALTISAAVGQRLPAYCTASGKLFLAYLPPDKLNAILSNPMPAHTPKTITSPDKLRAELETIRQRGYSFDEGELEDGIRAVAAPIRNHRGEIIATISIPGPVNRITPERIPEILASLVQTTQAISNRLGWKI